MLAHLTAAIQPGWHLYSVTTPRGGPIPTSVGLADTPAIASTKLYQAKPERKFDPNFQLDTETFQNEADFLFDVELSKTAAAGTADVTARARYQSCNDRLCLPPRTKTAAAAVAIDPAAPVATIAIPAGFTEVHSRPVAPARAAVPTTPAPVSTPAESSGLGWFLLTAFGFGIAAIFTPCVFPMIPITVSYFLNRQTGNRRDGLTQAVLFCLGIVVLFTSLGLLAKAIAGPFGVVQLGSSPWVNAFIAAVFIVFGLSLLGAFELTLPSGLLTRVDSASRRGGYVGTLLMGLTFSLTSFACVGPIVGPLLVSSIQGQGLQPVLGMMCFASGLAAPFFFLALFPQYLQRLPRSGVWMARVKVVLGFVILAAAVKYLSNIDQVLQWNVITRERFLAAWVVLFALAGLYLLGLLRLEGFKPDERLSVLRTLLGAAFLMFAVSLIPGMWGARLGDLDAYVPAAANGSFAGGQGAGASVAWLKNQYREALTRARAENKLVLVSFTGYACTNCHWMKANMFPRPEVEAALKNLVPVELYTDGSDAASESNQQLQEKKFGTVAIPFYAIVSPDEKVIATFPGLTRDARQFVAFLTPKAGGTETAWLLTRAAR